VNVRISQALSTPRKSTHTYLLRNHRGGKPSITLIRNDGGSRVVHLEWMPRYDRQDVAPVRDRRPRAHDTIRRSNRKPSKNPGCYGQEHQHHIRIHAAAKRLCFDWMLTEHSKPCVGLHSCDSLYVSMFLPSAGSHRGGRLSMFTRCAKLLHSLHTCRETQQRISQCHLTNVISNSKTSKHNISSTCPTMVGSMCHRLQQQCTLSPLMQAKGHSGGLHVHDNGSRSHTNMHQKAKGHIWQHARAWGDTSGLHGSLINHSSDTGECLLSEKMK